MSDISKRDEPITSKVKPAAKPEAIKKKSPESIGGILGLSGKQEKTLNTCLSNAGMKTLAETKSNPDFITAVDRALVLMKKDLLLNYNKAIKDGNNDFTTSNR